MMNSTKAALQHQSGEMSTVSVDRLVCDACQDTCYSVEVWARGLLGGDHKVCTLYRPHVRSQGLALLHVASYLRSVGGLIADWDAQSEMRERQQTLFSEI